MIGETISHYRILEKLGEGGMGVVYKAEDTRLKRIVALKFLPPSLTSNPEARSRFIQEAQAASALDHPNICTVHDFGESADGQFFIVMACYEGKTLQEMLQNGPFEIERALTIGAQIAAGLAEAHRVGVIHRDVKPTNVIITKDGAAKIIDFGLAKLAAQSRITRTGSAMGTPVYMSPEQIRGDEVDARTDIWSLGVILYEMLTGCTPFAADYDHAVFYRILNMIPEPLTSLRQGVPPAIERTLERALQKDPVERYPSALALLQDLEFARTGGETHPSIPKTVASIAILPFEDMSQSHDQEYFCDGIAEEIINALTHVAGLRVVARTSSFSFKGTQKNARDIGRMLGVDTLLEGSVRKADQRLRVTVKLTKVDDESALWSERYDRTLEDIFAIQDDVCVSIVDQLKVILGRSERTNLVRRRANDHEAYNLYLKGRFLFNQRKRESVQRSIECYSQAVTVDPAFALAYAGIAESYEVLGSWRDLPRDQAFGEARKASETALRLDDRLPEAHVVAGYVNLFCDWNWTAAEREFQRALTLNPACAEGHHMRAHYLEMMGKFDLAIGEIDRAMELEPVAPSLHSCAAQILYCARRYDKAIRQAYVTLEMAPTFYGLYGWIGSAYLVSGLHDSGLAALKEGLKHLPQDPRLQALLGTACALSGDEEGARAALARLHALSRERYVDSYYTTWLLEAMGNRHDACESLETAYNERSNWLPWLAVDPLLDNLRSDPRCAALLKNMGLAR
jgi:serine/threonine-protein kinase